MICLGCWWVPLYHIHYLRNGYLDAFNRSGKTGLRVCFISSTSFQLIWRILSRCDSTVHVIDPVFVVSLFIWRWSICVRALMAKWSACCWSCGHFVVKPNRYKEYCKFSWFDNKHKCTVVLTSTAACGSGYICFRIDQNQNLSRLRFGCEGVTCLCSGMLVLVSRKMLWIGMQSMMVRCGQWTQQ